MPSNLLPDFAADWRDMIFVHYRFAPADVRRAAAFPVDRFDGDAYVSLVLFRLTRMGFAGWGPAGRWACRPISDHYFLNLRTYVRTPQGEGIEFLAEWIPNRLSLWLGPRVYGLPYRPGAFTATSTADIRTWTVTEPAEKTALQLEVGPATGEAEPCRPGSLEAFLFERYRAFTSDAGTERTFAVEHKPWQLRRPAWVSCLTGLVERAFPWFERGELVAAHETAGLRQVRMTRPLRVRPEAADGLGRRRPRNQFFSALE